MYLRRARGRLTQLVFAVRVAAAIAVVAPSEIHELTTQFSLVDKRQLAFLLRLFAVRGSGSLLLLVVHRRKLRVREGGARKLRAHRHRRRRTVEPVAGLLNWLQLRHHGRHHWWERLRMERTVKRVEHRRREVEETLWTGTVNGGQ
jgi:hypothetical protein